MATYIDDNIIAAASPEKKDLPKRTFSPKTFLNMKELRKNSLLEESFFSRVKYCIKGNYELLRNSKLPTFLCIVIYILICLVGNLVTGIIWFKHNRYSMDNSSKELSGINNLSGLTLLDFMVNETTLESALEQEMEMYELELSILSDLIDNTTKNENLEHEPTCYEPLDDKLRINVKFWIEGVVIFAIAPFGMLFNLLSAFVFRRSRGNKGFHTLLIILALVDSVLLLDMLIEKTIIPYYTSLSPIEPEWYKISYPYFWHPFKGIITTVAIYLMVAISAERYRAVCYPLSRRHSPYKYVLLVITTSIIMKLPRFLQLRLITLNGNTDYWTTEIMDDVVYIRFSSYWDDLFVTGALPLIILMFLNLRIYLKIRTSANMELERFIGSGISSNRDRKKKETGVDNDQNNSQYSMKLPKMLLNDKKTEDIALSNAMKSNNNFDNKDENDKLLQHDKKAISNSQTNFEICKDNIYSEKYPDRIEAYENTNSAKTMGSKGKAGFCNAYEKKLLIQNDSLYTPIGPCEEEHEEAEDNNSREIMATVTFKNECLRHRKRIPHQNSRQQLSRLKVRTEKSAAILGLIVILFIFTHCYRMALKVYEVALPNQNTIEHFKTCFILKRHHVPVTFYLLFHLNNLFLVINSSINFVICYCAGKEFRKQTKIILQEIKENCSTFLKLFGRK